jgi:hypothetical protein
VADWHALDMGGILGIALRNLGFSLTHHGFYLRLPELDESKTFEHQTNIADEDGTLFLSHGEFIRCCDCISVPPLHAILGDMLFPWY